MAIEQAKISREQTDVLVIGGGAAGMAAALAASCGGARRVLLVEREPRLGGVLPQCLHQGFGLSYFQQDLNGAEYAARFVRQIENSPVQVRTGCTVLQLRSDRTALLCGEKGLSEISFSRAVLASGCREKPLGALHICGSRPAGIFTAGQAQKMVNLSGYDIGDDIIILGSGDIGLVMACCLHALGKRILAVVEQKAVCTAIPRHQRNFNSIGSIPMLTSATIDRIHGEQRISGVTLRSLRNGSRGYLPCSTLLIAAGLIPERELAEPLLQQGKLPDWLALSGNCEHVHRIVDTVTEQGELAGYRAAAALADR